MRVRLTMTVSGPNPEFDRARRVGPDNVRDRQLPAGSEIEHPDAWRLCLPDARGLTRAEPVDDEAIAQVKLAGQRREQTLARMSSRQLAARVTLADKLPTLQADGTNGPSPATEQAVAKRRRAGR